MKILIDTHIFLWMLSCPEKLDEKMHLMSDDSKFVPYDCPLL
jgi:PIN domain nuclease of toxin-antitoxin system